MSRLDERTLAIMQVLCREVVLPVECHAGQPRRTLCLDHCTAIGFIQGSVEGGVFVSSDMQPPGGTSYGGTVVRASFDG
jgi:hypothetical protein